MYTSSNQAVATELFAVVPSDTVNFAKRARRIYIGTGGNLTYIDGKGNAVAFVNLPAGYTIDAECLRINATGLTAGAMVGFV